LSVRPFEKTPISQAFSESGDKNDIPYSNNQLTLLDY
jgi:hypothetical protein